MLEALGQIKLKLDGNLLIKEKNFYILLKKTDGLIFIDLISTQKKNI